MSDLEVCKNIPCLPFFVFQWNSVGSYHTNLRNCQYQMALPMEMFPENPPEYTVFRVQKKPVAPVLLYINISKMKFTRLSKNNDKNFIRQNVE